MNLVVSIFGPTGKKALIALAVMTATVAMADTKFCQSTKVSTPRVFQAAGPTADSIQSTVDRFRDALGGPNNGNNPGPLDSGRREINWDGGGSTATSPGPTPFDVFLNTRGNRSTTPGTGFLQAPAQGLADFFGRPEYATIFVPFSRSRLFTAVGSNVTDTSFFVPGPDASNKPAVTRGFGLVFTDVDQPDGSGPGQKKGNRKASTLVEYYAADGSLLFSSFVPASPGDGGLSFFGIIFDDSRIARVHIIAGSAVPGEDDTNDVVVMDDFLYGEPVAVF